MHVKRLFEAELLRRGIAWTIDAQTDRHLIALDGRQVSVGLDNLERDFANGPDGEKIAFFVDAVVKTASPAADAPSAERLYWVLEPNDYEKPAAIRFPVSKRADRVLIHLSSEDHLVTWVSPDLLESLGVSATQAASIAFANLERALAEATLEKRDVDGVALGLIATPLPFKAALILAPNFKEVIGAELGWPLLAVAPDRDFLYLWAARHSDFADRVGAVVVREYSHAPYPISTEIFELSDQGVTAIGAFAA